MNIEFGLTDDNLVNTKYAPLAALAVPFAKTGNQALTLPTVIGHTQTKLRDALNLPADARIVGAVAFGIPDENPSQPAKKPLSETVHLDRW